MITNGILTSATISALILKKPVIFCDFYDLYSYDEYANIILECKDKNKFLELLHDSHKINVKNYNHIENFLEKNYFKTDGLSSERVVNAIKQLIKNKNTN